MEGGYTKPIRVIDVDATIRSIGGVCFKKPDKATDFHVISHTWSQVLRDFSEQIRALLQKCSASTSKLASVYNEALRDANFSKNECYIHLKFVLEILQNDGVRYVWLDALCIDQTNNTEKGEEISRMGVYFSDNKGCYVLTHGIGNGYAFSQSKSSGNSSNATDIIPQWFRRAWTLQEFLLPTKLTFLVAFSSRQVQCINQYMTEYMRKHNLVVGFCKCCLSDSFDSEFSLKMDSPDLIYERDIECNRCRSFPLVRTTSKKDAMAMVYFIDRYAYNTLSDIFHSSDVEHIDWVERYDIDFLMKLLKNQSPMVIAREITKRKCSINEDRILCILGLLGCNEVKPVRTGLQLEEQILRLCQNNEDLLIQLCAISTRGNDKPGMSWAPRLHFDNSPQNSYWPGRITQKDVGVVNVSPKGIKLSANIRKLVLGYRYDEFRLEVDDSLHLRGYESGAYGYPYFSFEREHGTPEGFLLGELCMHGLHEYNDWRYSEFEMWWILLGDIDFEGKDCKVVMACVGEEENLHKIGLFWINLKLASRIFFQTPTSPRSPCFVGGFGKFMDKHVRRSLRGNCRKGECHRPTTQKNGFVGPCSKCKNLGGTYTNYSEIGIKPGRKMNDAILGGTRENSDKNRRTMMNDGILGASKGNLDKNGRIKMKDGDLGRFRIMQLGRV